ncbi:acetoacetate decarboxylase [Sesbania bispinosa]|nr:acetoacetate decarboxylase [Sesbania bispinosa]
MEEKWREGERKGGVKRFLNERGKSVKRGNEMFSECGQLRHLVMERDSEVLSLLSIGKWFKYKKENE